MTHQELLSRAVALAAEHSQSGANGPFGAVIARKGAVIVESWNRVVEWKDPTAHAEIVAIREACRRLGTHRLSGYTIYINCEPCPMCLAAIYWARLDAVYYASSRQDAADAGFDDARIYREINLPDEKRSLSMVKIPLDHAADVFRKWVANPAKQIY